jgi:hypothetical protein
VPRLRIRVTSASMPVHCYGVVLEPMANFISVESELTFEL